MKRLPAGVVALGLVSLFMDMSSEMIHALLPLYLTGALGASALMVGLIEGVGQAVAQFAKLGSGLFSDLSGRRKSMMVLGYGLGAVTKPVFALAGAPGWVLAARVADRFGKGIRGAPRDAMLADMVPLPQRSAAYGLRQSMDSLGALAGPLIAVALIGIWGLSIPWIFAIAVVPAVLSVAVLVVAVKEPPMVTPPARTRIDAAALRQMGAPVWWAVGLGTAITLARFSDAFLVLRADEIGLPLLFIPLILVALNAVDAATSWPVGVLAGHIGKGGLLLSSMVVLALAQLVLAYGSGQGALFAGVALWGLHMGLSQGLLAAMVGEAAPPHLRGTAFGIFGLATGVAVLVGNAVAGAVWATSGSQAMFTLGAALSGIAVVMGLVRRRA